VTTCTAPDDTTAGQPSVSLLRAAVGALIGQPADRSTVAELTEQIAGVTRQLDRLDGWVRAAEGELSVRTGGLLPTDDGAARSVAGWLADVRLDSASAAGSRLRTAGLLRQLPLIADAVLEGLLTPAQAHVLTRLVGKIDAEALLESQESMLLIAAPLDVVALRQWVAHQIATHVAPALEAEQDRAHDRRFPQTSREADGGLRGRFLLSREDSEAFLTAVEPLARRTDMSDARSAGQPAPTPWSTCASRPCAAVTCPPAAACGRSWPTSCRPSGPPPSSSATPAPAAVPAAPTTSPGPSQRASSATSRDPPAPRPPTGVPPPPGRGRRPAPASRRSCATPASADCCSTAPAGAGAREPVRRHHKAQRRLLAARDLGCTARGCTRPPAFCDAHHLVRRANGGLTTLGTLVHPQAALARVAGRHGPGPRSARRLPCFPPALEPRLPL
jgi:hypothetical protein